MAYFAKLDDNDVVIAVHTVNNLELIDLDGTESESMGKSFYIKLSGGHTNWVQTSYNGRIRKNYAGVGYNYDRVRDAFIPPNPFASWILNENTCLWESPAPYPQDDKNYYWDEPTTSWVELLTSG